MSDLSLTQPKLKECPFCGGNARLWVEAGINIDVWGYAECDLCEARGAWAPSVAAAAEKWNRRAGDEANLSTSQRSNQK
ncbi:restriction alleviation protein, Lar family [Escherichia coli]|nr:restriction alleviation protein, Lar family [Escherichia coli]EFV2549257.1 restriction alleviation protein, Lar family [Escherichia coli]